MAIRVQCNSCRKSYQVPEAFAGKQVKCKNCGRDFPVPPKPAIPEEIIYPLPPPPEDPFEQVRPGPPIPLAPPPPPPPRPAPAPRSASDLAPPPAPVFGERKRRGGYDAGPTYGGMMSGFRLLRIALLVIALIGWLIKRATTNSNAPSKQPTALNQDADPPPQPAPRANQFTPPPKNLPPQEQLPEDVRPLHDASIENLTNLFAALQKYASTDPQGYFPEKLSDLVASGLLPAEAIRSPFDLNQTYLFFPRHGQEKVNFAVLAYDPAELSRYGVTLVLNSAGNVTATTRLGLTDFMNASDRALAQAPVETRAPKIASNLPGRSSQVPPRVARPVEPPASREFLDTFAATKSPLVAEIREIDAGTGIREILHPLATSPFAAIVKADDANQDVVQIWDLLAGQKQAEATFARDAGAPGEYAINPTGTLLARVAKWPRLSLRIWSINDQKEIRAIPLNPAFGTAAVHGFLTPEKVAVRWSNRGLDGFEIWDANTGAHGKQVTFDVFKRSPSNGVVTPDGKLFALTNQQQRTNRPIFELYDLFGPLGGYHWYPISDMEGRVAQTPAGMAFSPDNKKLAVLFEQAGAGIIYCWRVADGKQLGEYPITITTHLKPPPQGARGLDWIADGAAWLIMGDLLVDSTTGRQLGNLNAPPATDQWMADPATLVLRYEAGKDQPRVACVKIDTSQLTQATTAPAK
ncbi:MAG TPA: hypothetical protein VH370_00170 [Humisphaera sp.]|jgi:hypothetical protein|nr:hypothetical protein [Humisphaera sp.]